MAVGHEKLDVYRAAIESVGWADRYCETLKERRHANDQRRSIEIARGSASECAAIQDVLQVFEALSAGDNNQQKAPLDRRVAMLTKLGQRGYAVREELGEYRASQFDTHTDTVLTPAFGAAPTRA